MTKFCAGTILTSQVMDSQKRAIGKAIKPLFAEPVTNMFIILAANQVLADLQHCTYCNFVNVCMQCCKVINLI